jgi:hypothetical protein
LSHAGVIAQQVGGTDLNIVSLITQVGFSGVFLWQWLEATKERKASQKALEALSERLLPVLVEATAALERVQTSMSHQVDKAERTNPSPADLERTIRRLEWLTEDFGRRFPRSERGNG